MHELSNAIDAPGLDAASQSAPEGDVASRPASGLGAASQPTAEFDAASQPTPGCDAASLPPEPCQADVRELLNPARLLVELGWSGPEGSLGEPIPNNVMAEGRQFEWEWTGAPEAQAPSIAYLLPGLPPEGSGGSHSLVQEARGLRALGAAARVCVPVNALARAEGLYGNEDGLFVAYAEEAAIAQAVGGATVVVSTEYTSVRLAERIVRERPEVACAYYVQDYEPLFAAPASARSDDALLSYRAIPGQALFAKTHWLRNVVMARHGVPVMKVAPSLDRSLFHAQGRLEREGAVRVAAMVRPRTPRRRARATLMALEELARRLGGEVQTLAFGCDADAFDELCASTGGEDVVAHLGLLTRAEVAEVMRRTDVFVDASAYQAFGRTGLEAMACGAVPVLPALGGVGEYAEHDRNAVIFEQDSPMEIAEAVCELVADRERLIRLREAGVRAAAQFSIERAARSQLGLFAAVTARGAGGLRPGREVGLLAG
jgi:Glycosyl transferases group 1